MQSNQKVQLTAGNQNEWEKIPLYVREKQVRSDIIPISHGALWEWVAKRTFPAPIKLSSGVTVWKRSDLMAWAIGMGA
jgi:prophage regulatory protein